jgi:DHA1 family inner membrane transport protein
VPLALLALAVAAFAIGTTEFVVVGLAPTLADDLGVSVSAAGTLVTGYAVGVAVGGVLLTALTARVPRRRLLIWLMVVFSAGHLVMALAPGFPLLLAARIVTASCHGAFFGAGAVVAAELVPRDRRSRAIAVMFTGLTTATVLGVPAGTQLGQALGWRAPFVAIAVLAAVAALAVARLVPHDTGAAAPVLDAEEARPRRLAPLVVALATTVIGWGSQFVAFTFFAAYLREVTGMSPLVVTSLLLVFGVAAAIGNLLGGQFDDARPRLAIPVLLAALAGVEVLFAVLGRSPIAVVVLVFLLGLLGFALVPGLQSAVMAVVDEGSNLGSTLNIAAFNVGIAGASALGAVMVAHGGLRWTPVVAAALSLVAVPLAAAGRSPARSVVA